MQVPGLQTVTIANGGTESGEVEVPFSAVAAIEIGTLTGATLEVRGSYAKGGTKRSFTPTVVLTATDNTILTLTADQQAALSALRFLSFVSALAEVAERTLRVITKSEN